MRWPSSVFVTGTDTGVGKSFISSVLLSGLNGIYWKPIQSGVPFDSDFVKSLTAMPQGHFLKEKYCFSLPLSPHAAAKMDGKRIDFTSLQLPKVEASNLIIEGCGGLFVPLNMRYFMIDLIAKWKMPALLVAKSGLGTINHTLLSLDLLRRRKVPLLGVVMNGPKNDSNKKAIGHFGGVKLFEVDRQEQISPALLKGLFQKVFI